MLPPAPNLAVWLSDLLEYRDSPDFLDFDGLEDALDELRERAHSERVNLEQLEEVDPASPHLWDMLGQLEQITQELDLFLETELFYHLECAQQIAKNLLEQKLHLASDLANESNSAK
jgi:hypothetical protein